MDKVKKDVKVDHFQDKLKHIKLSYLEKMLNQFGQVQRHPYCFNPAVGETVDISGQVSAVLCNATLVCSTGS